MTSSPSISALQGNVLATTREQKLNDLLVQWYQVTAQTTPVPPPSDDPNLLVHITQTGYYCTSHDWEESGSRAISPPSVMEEISVDWNAVSNATSSALANSTGSETGEGYGTCVIKSFDGEFDGQKCLFKLIVVVVSFKFSSSEYNTDQDVVASGYWIHFFHTDPPFRYDQAVSGPVPGQLPVYQIPPDMSIVGRRYMTVEELDRYNP